MKTTAPMIPCCFTTSSNYISCLIDPQRQKLHNVHLNKLWNILKNIRQHKSLVYICTFEKLDVFLKLL